ncbi:MAG: hypothetical protein WAK17_18850, partial [Candidatus Nitrosopolaris sp.]
YLTTILGMNVSPMQTWRIVHDLGIVSKGNSQSSTFILSIKNSFGNYKHHSLLSFCWPMFNMIMLCQLSSSLEFLVTDIAFEFLPSERIEFHYSYY